MHTVWLREHNRIAKFLQFNNPIWDDERIFQETRRIVIGEYQHIIYKEWLPLIIGHELMTSFGLWPLSAGYSDQYLDTFDPRVTNEFSTAAFRFGHSLIPSTFNRIVQQFKRGARLGNPVTQSLSMKDIFFKPEQFQKNPGTIN
jgi:peroxidase